MITPDLVGKVSPNPGGGGPAGVTAYGWRLCDPAAAQAARRAGAELVPVRTRSGRPAWLVVFAKTPSAPTTLQAPCA